MKRSESQDASVSQMPMAQVGRATGAPWFARAGVFQKLFTPPTARQPI